MSPQQSNNLLLAEYMQYLIYHKSTIMKMLLATEVAKYSLWCCEMTHGTFQFFQINILLMLAANT